MTKTKNHILKGVFAALTATALIAGVMTGCGKSDSSSSGSGDTKETQVVTEVVSGILVDENGQPITDEKGNFISATEADKTDADKKQSSGDTRNVIAKYPLAFLDGNMNMLMGLMIVFYALFCASTSLTPP